MTAAMVAAQPICLTADTTEGLAVVGARAERGACPAPLHEWLRRALASDGLVGLSVAPPAGAGDGTQEVSAVVGEPLLEEPAGLPAGTEVERGWASLQLHDPKAAVGAFSALHESLRGAGLELAGLVAAGAARLLVPSLPAAAGAALRAGHALTPIELLQPTPPAGLPVRDGTDCKAFAGAWGLMRRELAGGAAVSEYRAGSSRAPVRLQAACGLFVEVPGVGAGAGPLASGCCGVLEAAAEPAGLVRHRLVDLRPPSGEPRGVEASVQGALLAESSRPAGAWREEWARLGGGEEVVALELAAEPGREGPARRGGWLFCGGRFARVVGPPVGSGVVSGACCRSLGQLQRLRGEEAVRQELEAQFEAVAGTIERAGLLQAARGGASKPAVFWSAEGGEGGEISRQGEEVVHVLPGGAEQRWRILEWGFDPFTAEPKDGAREERKGKDKRRKKSADSGDESDGRGKKSRAAGSESADERKKEKKRDKNASSSDSDTAAKRKKDKQREKEFEKRKDKDKKKKEKAADSDDASDDRGKHERRKDKKKEKRKEEGSSGSSEAAAKKKREKNKEKESDKRREKDRDRSASARPRKKLQIVRSPVRGEGADAAAAPVEVPSPAAADPAAAAAAESSAPPERGPRGGKITISMRPPPAGPPSHVTQEMVRKSAADADRMAAVDALLKKAVAGVTRKEDPAPAPPPALLDALLKKASAETQAAQAQASSSAAQQADAPAQSKASPSALGPHAKAQAAAPQAPVPAAAAAAPAAAPAPAPVAAPSPGAAAPARGPPPAEQTKAKPTAPPAASAHGKAAPPADPSAEKADLPANFAFPKGYPPPDPSAEKADLPENFAFPKGYPPPDPSAAEKSDLPTNFAFPQGYPPPSDFKFPEGYPPPPEGQPPASQAAAEAQAQAQAQAHAQAHAAAAAQATAAVHAQAAAAAQAHVQAQAAALAACGGQQPPPPSMLPGMSQLMMGMHGAADPNLHAAILAAMQMGMPHHLMMGAGAAFPPPGFPGASPVGLPLPGGQMFVPAPAVGSAMPAQPQAALPPQPHQPQVVSPPARAAAADPAVEQFLQETRADQRASGALRALPPELQRRVVAEGPVSGTNPSAVLMARVRKVEVHAQGAAAGTAPGAGADATPAAQASTQMQPMASHTAPAAQLHAAAFAARPPPPSGLPPGGGAMSKAGGRAAAAPIGPAIGPAPSSGLFAAGSPEAVFVQQNRVGREAEAALNQLSETLRARVMIEGPVGGDDPSAALLARIQKIQMAHSSAA